MADRQKVIKGLECCMIPSGGGCDDCPYVGKGICQELMGEDAITLLKAQEPMMVEERADREYQAAVEMAEYCERYEPTYNAEDGSM